MGENEKLTYFRMSAPELVQAMSGGSESKIRYIQRDYNVIIDLQITVRDSQTIRTFPSFYRRD